MDSSRALFAHLLALKNQHSPEEALRRLINYCKETLGPVERVHFDFKEKQDSRKPELDDSDKRNVAKAISGFANTEGGVLIWGIKDASLDLKPIEDVPKFVDSMLQLCHQVTSPSVVGIDGCCFTDGVPSRAGVGLVYVPQSDLPPHRVLLNQNEVKDRYFIRSGSSFVPATHSQLEDMFGRRPKPKLRINLAKRVFDEAKFVITVSVENVGRGIAKHPYVSLSVEPPFGIARFGLDGNGKVGMKLLDFTEPARRGDPYPDFASAQFGPRDGQVLHSGMSVDLTRIRGPLGPGVGALRVRIGIAVEGQPLKEAAFELSESDLLDQMIEMLAVEGR